MLAADLEDVVFFCSVALGVVLQHAQSAAFPGHSLLLPGPPETHGEGHGLPHAFWRRASAAQTSVATCYAAVPKSPTSLPLTI